MFSHGLSRNSRYCSNLIKTKLKLEEKVGHTKDRHKSTSSSPCHPISHHHDVWSASSVIIRTPHLLSRLTESIQRRGVHQQLDFTCHSNLLLNKPVFFLPRRRLSICQINRSEPAALLLLHRILHSRVKVACYKAAICTSSWSRTSDTSSDVPEYLVGSITEVDCPENEEHLEETENELEEEITDFLTCRSLAFYETDCSFIVSCPTCASAKDHKQSRDIFVDKHSGYYVCPWCCSAGTWQELCSLLDSRPDTLTLQQLEAIVDSTLPLTDTVALQLLNNSPYKALRVDTLCTYGCGVAVEAGRLVVPIWRSSKLVGYYSVPLLDTQDTKVVSRFVRGLGSAWSSFNVPSEESVSAPGCDASAITGGGSGANAAQVVVVSHICEALYLAQCGRHSLTVPEGVDWDNAVQVALNNSTTVSAGPAPVWGLPPNVQHVALWLTHTNTLPYRFFAHLNKGDICCAAVSPPGRTPLYQMTKEKIEAPLRGRLLPLLSDKVVPFDSLEEKIYQRITHKNEVHGVPWQRFSGLQSLLLGHRTGEVTVMSGPTGAGKTTFMAEYSLDLAAKGVVTLWVSLEVSVVRLCEVLLQQYSGAPLPHQRHLFTALAQHFKQLPIYFLDLHGQQDLQHIVQVLRESVVMRGVRHVIIDNLQFLVGCQDTATERWQQQDRAMAAFRSFATQQGCHVTLIVHPKKLLADEVLTMQSIGGGARVTQEADNVLLLQVQEGASPSATRKAIQVVKNRYGGHLGVVPIKFHGESLTFSGWFSKEKKKSKAKTHPASEPGDVKLRWMENLQPGE